MFASLLAFLALGLLSHDLPVQNREQRVHDDARQQRADHLGDDAVRDEEPGDHSRPEHEFKNVAAKTVHKVAHFDETGTDVNGKTIWVHNSSTPELTYQTINAKRGQIGMEDNGVLTEFGGVAIHDCWSPYWKYEDITHAVCNAHLLRELTGVEQYSPEHAWAPEFKTLLRSMKKARDKAVAKGKTELSYYYLHKFDTEYDRLMKLADEECPLPPDPPQKKKGRKKKGKERSLIERLMALKASVCLFIRNFDVPFDNNQAERDVRNVKTKTKVSGCFRTESGAQDYLDIMSYIGTGRKHGVSAYEALTAAFAGNAQIVLK